MGTITVTAILHQPETSVEIATVDLFCDWHMQLSLTKAI
jgi:hypothetical protein